MKKTYAVRLTAEEIDAILTLLNFASGLEASENDPPSEDVESATDKILVAWRQTKETK